MFDLHRFLRSWKLFLCFRYHLAENLAWELVQTAETSYLELMKKARTNSIERFRPQASLRSPKAFD